MNKLLRQYPKRQLYKLAWPNREAKNSNRHYTRITKSQIIKELGNE